MCPAHIKSRCSQCSKVTTIVPVQCSYRIVKQEIIQNISSKLIVFLHHISAEIIILTMATIDRQAVNYIFLWKPLKLKLKGYDSITSVSSLFSPIVLVYRGKMKITVTIQTPLKLLWVYIELNTKQIWQVKCKPTNQPKPQWQGVPKQDNICSHTSKTTL